IPGRKRKCVRAATGDGGGKNNRRAIPHAEKTIPSPRRKRFQPTSLSNLPTNSILQLTIACLHVRRVAIIKGIDNISVNIDFFDDSELMFAEILSIFANSATDRLCAMNNLSSRLWATCAAGIFINTERAVAYISPTDTSAAQNRVLLVHGIADSAASMRPLRARLARDGRKTIAINLKPSDGRISLEALSLQLRDYVRTHFSAGERLDLVGFSMGGLVCRYYVQMMGGNSRVDRLVTVSAP